MPTVNQLLKSLTFRNILKVGMGDISARAISMLSSILVIRAMPIDDYASFVVYMSVAVTLSGLAGNSVNVALVRFGAEFISREKYRPVGLYRGVFLAEFLVAVFLTILAAISPHKIALVFFGNSELVSALILGMLGGIATIVLQLAQTFYQTEEKFGKYVLTVWTRAFAIIVYTVILYLMKQVTFYPVAIGYMIIDFLIGGILVIRHLTIASPVEIENAKNLRLDKLFFVSSGWLIAYSIVLAAWGRIDIMMLSHFTSEEEIANYGVAFRYYSILLISLNSITVVLRPKLSQVDMLDFSRQRDFAWKWTRYAAWTTIPVALFILLCKPIYVWLNGAQYERSFSMLSILVIGVWLSIVLNLYTKILIANCKFLLIFILGCIAFAVAAIGNYYLVPKIGGLGASIVTVAANTVINGGAGLYFYLDLRKRYR